jgi:uncharacterized protein involved in type VI secretion and phage assembly
MSQHARAAAADQRIYGVVHGLVVDVVDPDAIGRVKISLPWYASGYQEWARVAQLYAGDGFGSTWIPEIDCEVLISFAHGDMRFPYVLGCLYSPVDPPPLSRTASSDVKTLRTPAGSELSFDEGEGTIALKTPSGALIRLEEKAGAITLESAKTIDLKAAAITIEATQKLGLKAAAITIEATTEVTIQGAKVAIN